MEYGKLRYVSYYKTTNTAKKIMIVTLAYTKFKLE